MLDRSIMALLLGLFRTDLLANDISAVTRVIEMLKNHLKIHKHVTKWSLITFSSAVVYCDLVWIPLPGLIIHYRAELIYLTGHQICAWGSQRALSASCLLPAYTCTFKYCQNCLIIHYHSRRVKIDSLPKCRRPKCECIGHNAKSKIMKNACMKRNAELKNKEK